MTARSFVALLFLLASSTLAAQDRAEFKGLPLGSTMAEFQDKNPLFWCERGECSLPFLSNAAAHCQKLKRTNGGREFDSPTSECYLDVAKTASYANKPARLRAQFRDDKMSEATASFVPVNYEAIVEALVTRFGRPASKRSEVVQNKMGATFQNETSLWNVGGDQIIAMKYGSDLTRGFVNIKDQQEVARLKEGEEKRRKSAPSDL